MPQKKPENFGEYYKKSVSRKSKEFIQDEKMDEKSIVNEIR